LKIALDVSITTRPLLVIYQSSALEIHPGYEENDTEGVGILSNGIVICLNTLLRNE